MATITCPEYGIQAQETMPSTRCYGFDFLVYVPRMTFSKSKIAAAIVLVFMFSQNASAAPIKAGAVCAKIGQKSVVAKQTFTCVKSGNKLIWTKVPADKSHPTPQASVTPTPTPTPTPTADPAILPTDYASVAPKAKSLILSSIPSASTIPTIVFDAEPSVPQINISRMKEEATAALKIYASLLPDVKAVHFLLYENDSWGLQHALLLNGASDYPEYNFAQDMKNSFTGRPEQHLPCRSFGGFSVASLKEPLVVIQGAECDWADARETAQGIDYSSSVIAHEITHLVQQRISGTNNAVCAMPAWLREGQAQVGAIALSVVDGVDASANTRIAIFGRMARPTGIDAFQSIEIGHGGAEYNVGAALSEYLIARSGWNKVISVISIVNSGSHSCPSDSQVIKNFTSAYEKVYGQSLTSLYEEALPYVQYVFDHQPRI